MAFDVGDKVVYPQHGAAVVERRETKVLAGEKREYLVLRIARGDLTLSVPSDNAELVGVREVISEDEAEQVLAVLGSASGEMDTNWTRRFKDHEAMLRTGGATQIAEVVRNLHGRDCDSGLSAGEKQMLAKARALLESELVFALGADDAEIQRRVDEVLR